MAGKHRPAGQAVARGALTLPFKLRGGQNCGPKGHESGKEVKGGAKRWNRRGKGVAKEGNIDDSSGWRFPELTAGTKRTFTLSARRSIGNSGIGPAGLSQVFRRPERAWGTQTTILLTERAISETLDAFPDEHILAIGDISAPSGGTITQHRSHQSGRDIDVGLFYREKPAGYPASFVHADEDNLDCAATFKLLESFLATADDDGGVQMIFLDFDVQGVLYDWALDHGISERRLERIFQYPHGRGSGDGIVRHEPNHDNHMHVRFKCPADDSGCR